MGWSNYGRLRLCCWFCACSARHPCASIHPPTCPPLTHPPTHIWATPNPPNPPHPRLQQYARDARKEYAELGSKDLSELKSFVKGLPKVLLLDRLSDLAVPVAEVVKQQVGLSS